MAGITDYQIVSTMAKCGGSFARALANAAHCADPVNFAKLKATFPELWEEYAEMAMLAARQDGRT